VGCSLVAFSARNALLEGGGREGGQGAQPDIRSLILAAVLLTMAAGPLALPPALAEAYLVWWQVKRRNR
jgi:hypothetical protein